VPGKSGQSRVNHHRGCNQCAKQRWRFDLPWCPVSIGPQVQSWLANFVRHIPIRNYSTTAPMFSGPTGGNTRIKPQRLCSKNPLCQSCDRGPSIFDIRHRFVGTYIWDLPYIHNTSNLATGIAKAITRDLDDLRHDNLPKTGLNGTIFNGVDSLGDGQSFNDRARLSKDATKGIFDKARLWQARPQTTGAWRTRGYHRSAGSISPARLSGNWGLLLRPACLQNAGEALRGDSLWTLRGEAYNGFQSPEPRNSPI